MSTSGGGGYCDCGDSEAWKAGVFCGKHQPMAMDVEDTGVTCIFCNLLFFNDCKFVFSKFTNEKCISPIF